MPAVIMAGAEDLVVSHRHAERLQASIQGSTLEIIPGVGHMIHHVATSQVVQAITDVTARFSAPTASDRPEDTPLRGDVPAAA